jgi:hypothetical protein
VGGAVGAALGDAVARDGCAVGAAGCVVAPAGVVTVAGVARGLAWTLCGVGAGAIKGVAGTGAVELGV